MPLSKTDHVLEKTENISIRLEVTPVQPSGFVVLVIVDGDRQTRPKTKFS